MKMSLRKWLVALLLVVLFTGLTGCSGTAAEAEEDAGVASEGASDAVVEEKLQVGFVYLSTPGDVGWTYTHDEARKYLEEQLPYVETLYVENVPEGGGDPERVMEQMIKKGVKVIIATSFGYMDSVINVAAKYPDVYFLHATGFKRADNVTTYDIREHDATYLTGFIAGKMTQSGKIGYVAAQPIPSVIRAVDSFALGVKEANPEAIVQLVWTSTWYDPAKEHDAAISLVESGADVLAQYQNTPAVQQAAQESGVFSIGFHSDMSTFAPDANLTSFMWNWGDTYVQEVEKYHDGTWKSEDLWPGMSEGAAGIAPINVELVPEDVMAQVEELRISLENGEKSVFMGPIKDNEGNLMAVEGEIVGDDMLRSIGWLVDNVKGALPNAN
jgi:basic membrane protein A